MGVSISIKPYSYYTFKLFHIMFHISFMIVSSGIDVGVMMLVDGEDTLPCQREKKLPSLNFKGIWEIWPRQRNPITVFIDLDLRAVKLCQDHDTSHSWGKQSMKLQN